MRCTPNLETPIRHHHLLCTFCSSQVEMLTETFCHTWGLKTPSKRVPFHSFQPKVAIFALSITFRLRRVRSRLRCPASWTLGASSSISWPSQSNFNNVEGSPGMQSFIMGNQYAIGASNRRLDPSNVSFRVPVNHLLFCVFVEGKHGKSITPSGVRCEDTPIVL